MHPSRCQARASRGCTQQRIVSGQAKPGRPTIKRCGEGDDVIQAAVPLPMRVISLRQLVVLPESTAYVVEGRGLVLRKLNVNLATMGEYGRSPAL